MTAKTRTAAIAAAAVAALALPGAASAETVAPPAGTSLTAPCSEVRDINYTSFNVRLCGVADVDQFRNGLELGGNAHCGPASLYNSLLYLQNKVGLPVKFGVTPLAGIDPRDPAQYGLNTSLIGWLGWQAKFDGGTTLGNLRGAFDVVTADAESKGWKAHRGAIDNRNVQDFGSTLAQYLKSAPLQLVYGRYKPSVDGYERDGGHILTVVAAQGVPNGDTIELTLADPGRAPDHVINPDYLDSQSAYHYQKVTLKRVTFREYVPMDDYQTEMGGGGGAGWRNVERWEMVDAPYTSTKSRQMVEGFNWFWAYK